MLEKCGIDQDPFQKFLKAFHGASQASKWLSAVLIAAFGAGFVPNNIAFGVALAVQVASSAAIKMQHRWRFGATAG